jgi:hypothetical protein
LKTSKHYFGFYPKKCLLIKYIATAKIFNFVNFGIWFSGPFFGGPEAKYATVKRTARQKRQIREHETPSKKSLVKKTDLPSQPDDGPLKATSKTVITFYYW